MNLRNILYTPTQWETSRTKKLTSKSFLIIFCPRAVEVVVYLYSEHIFSHTQHILHTSLQNVHTQTRQDRRTIDCSRTGHNDSTCQVWSGCMKLHRVQWPPGVSSQLWQMARVGSGSADSGAVWLITPAADTNTATGFVCRLLRSPNFFPPTCSYCILALFIPCNFKPKSKAFFF